MDEWDLYNLVNLDLINAECEKAGTKQRPYYTTELAIKICTTIATDPRPLKQICESNPDFPAEYVIHRWRVFYPVFGRNFNVAKKCQAQLLIDEILEIMDDPANCEPEILNWAKQRVDVRKWMAVKLLPKIYGDKQQSDVTVKHEDGLKDLA